MVILTATPPGRVCGTPRSLFHARAAGSYAGGRVRTCGEWSSVGGRVEVQLG